MTVLQRGQRMKRAENRTLDDFDSLACGLPHDFDFTVIRNTEDAESLVWTLPNSDRGKAARGLYRGRKVIGCDVVFAGMMAAWEHDHNHVAHAFGSSIAFALALKAVAPPHGRTETLRAWRGILPANEQLQDATFGPSWTTDRDIAAWFAMRFYFNQDGARRPFVYCADFEPDDIVAFNDSRNEAEVIVHKCRKVFVDHDGTHTLGPARLVVPSAEALVSWKEGYERVCQRRQKSAASLA
jgi:hypothetical protein